MLWGLFFDEDVHITVGFFFGLCHLVFVTTHRDNDCRSVKMNAYIFCCPQWGTYDIQGFWPQERKTPRYTGVSKPRRIKRIRRIRRIHILRKIVISKLRRISIILISLIILKFFFSYSFSHELPPRINIVFSVSNFLSTDNFKKIWICNERNMAVRLE